MQSTGLRAVGERPSCAPDDVQAASTNTRRTWLLPALVMPPRRSRLPLECSLGTRPEYAIRCGASEKRR